MSKMAKFLASKKGKSSVKASVDSALQGALGAPESDSTPDVLDNLKNVTKAETEDWGADSDSEPIAGSTIVVGGHFHLISEEDVIKKQQRKPRKWGEVIQGKTVEGTSAEEQKLLEEKPQESKPVLLYKAGMGMRRLFQQKPLDVQNEELFPGLEGLSAKTTVNSTTAPKKKEKKVEEKQVAKKTDDENVLQDECIIEQEGNNEGTSSLMVIEEFLHDIPKLEASINYDDSASKAKFIGRKKRPRIPLPVGEC